VCGVYTPLALHELPPLILGKQSTAAEVASKASNSVDDQIAAVPARSSFIAPTRAPCGLAGACSRFRNVRLWHKADIDFDDEHVRFRGQSGHL